MKRFASGVLTGMVLATSITVFAAGGRTIEVFDSVKRVVVNKVEKPFNASNRPFVYNGTTYVPLRFVADAFGEKVSWDNQSGTIYIGETEITSADHWGKDINKSDWDEYNFSYEHSYGNPNKTVKSNTTNTYTNYLRFYGYNGEGRYGELTMPLGGKYATFKALVGYVDSYEYPGETKMTILVDGKVAYSKIIERGMLEEPVNINLKGASKITFRVEGLGNSEKSQPVEVALFNGEFIK